MQRPAYPKAKRRWCFIHVPKTGGTSIGHALGPDGYHVSKAKRDYRYNPTHLRAVDICEHWGFAVWSRCFSFAAVRNPWDRAVSFWRDETRYGRTERSFGEWYDRTPLHLLRQWPYIADPFGLIAVSYIMRFEELERDFDIVCRQLQMTTPPLGRANSGGGRVDYHELFNDDRAENLRLIAAREIELFGYEF